MIDWFINLNFIYKTLLATLFTFSMTIMGSMIVFFFKKVNKNIMDALLGLSAGVMVSASFWSLLLPSIELSNNILIPVLGFAIGGLFLFIFDKIFSKYNYESKYKRIIMLIFSITLHNIPEGICIGVSFSSLLNASSSIIDSLMLTLGIGVQNFPEGSAVSLPLKREGFSNKMSFIIGSLSAVVEPIFGVIGAILAYKFNKLLPFLLSFAAGSMIYVVVEELIPESQSNENKSLMAMFTILGFTIMMILDNLFG